MKDGPPDPGVAPIGTQTTAPPPCTCYCFVNWVAPLPAPDVDDPGMPTNAVATVGGKIVEAETTTGSTYWTANVNQKTYNCRTKTVIATTPLVLNLEHNRYTITRTRVLGPSTTTLFGYTFSSGPYYVPPTTVGFGGYTVTTPEVVIGIWGAWSAPARANGPVLANAAALATSSPPSTPDCPSAGIACP